MAMPTSAEMTLLDADLTLAGRSARGAVVVALEDELPALADEQAAQLRQGAGRGIDGRGVEGVGADPRDEAERHDDDDAATESGG